MKRKTLAQMTAPEVVIHYRDLNQKRFDRALAMREAAMQIPRSNRGMLVVWKLSCQMQEKAYNMAKPRSFWQSRAAEQHLKRYGVKVAAAFLAANGWSVEAAYWILFKKSYPGTTFNG
jgi:hypothetical protein